MLLIFVSTPGPIFEDSREEKEEEVGAPNPEVWTSEKGEGNSPSSQ